MPHVKTDSIVVGAGIVGLAHAYHLARAGRRVTVLERDRRAVGASVRNFGMVWPVGQPLGEVRDTALRSRDHWRTLLSEAGLWHRECGALHLAYAEDELQVMREFVESAPEAARMVGSEEARRICPWVRSEGMVGGMRSETEMAIDARITVRELAAHLERAYGVEFRFGTPVRKVVSGVVETEHGSFEGDEIFVCLGPDAYAMFGESVRELRRCRLQMMRLVPKEPNLNLGTHLCAGLTLAHYANFAGCPSLPALKERFRRDWPEQVERGIHLLVSQQGDGSITVGDSHEYGDTFAPYRDERTDDLILAYLDTFLPRELFRVAERWDGFYNTHSTMPWLINHPLPGVILVNLFGTGMTLSFGVAEKVVAGGGGGMIRLAIFDLAGTTLEDHDDVARCLVDALAAVGTTVTLRAANDLMGIPKPEAIRGLAPTMPDEQVEKVHQDFRRRALAHYRTGEDVVEMPGTSDVFRTLKSQGIKVGIETGFDRETCDAVLDRMAWGDLIDASAASDEVEKGRPHGFLVRKLMADLGVADPASVMKVGDTPADLGEGTNAGCGMVVGVLSGAYDRAGLEPLSHTHIVDSVRDVPALLSL